MVDDPVGAPVEPLGVMGLGEREADPVGKSLPERAGGDLDPRGVTVLGVAWALALPLAKALQVVDREFDVTPAQIAIAWVMGRGDDIVPLIGARRPDRLTEALGAADLTLSNEDLARIEEAIPPGSAAGERDAPEYLPAMDSEQAPVVSGGAA